MPAVALLPGGLPMPDRSKAISQTKKELGRRSDDLPPSRIMDMGSTGVKFSGGKIVPHSVLRAGTTSVNPWQRLKHRDIVIGTWNASTLYSSGALEILTRELDQSPLDVVALQEVRWPGEGSQGSGSFTLFYGGAERPEFGTGFLVRRRILSAIREVHFVSDRISYIILKVNYMIL